MIGEPRKGTAILDVAPELLATVMTSLPAAFTVVGSEASDSLGYVRLVLESAEIASGYRARMTCEIEDVGLRRVIQMRHVGPARA